MRLARLLIEGKEEILSRWRSRVGKKLGGGALDRDLLEDGWGGFLDCVAARLAHPDAPVGDDLPDGSAHGAQRLHLGFDASEIVRETGALHAAVLATAAARGIACDVDEHEVLVRCFYTALATAVGEHTRRRDADAEREIIDQLGGLAGALDGTARGEELSRLHAWAASHAAWPLAEGARRDRFPLARVLAAAVSELATVAAERGVPVLVDLATPIEVDGDRDLLRRALARVLRRAIAATRRGGSVVVNAQMLTGGRVRIDVRDECGGRGCAPAGHFVRPALALGVQTDAVDWSIVRRAIAANRGTVHARKLPGVGCLVTIDVPGRGDVDPCCDGEGDGGDELAERRDRYRNVTASTTSSWVSTLSKRT